jgi:chemotaxis protein methyltransferase CheR
MDDSYQVNDQFDIIFCRNVLIYFDRDTQEKVINKLCRHLRQDGFFFLGHSESITNIDVPLKQLKPTVYSRL